MKLNLKNLILKLWIRLAYLPDLIRFDEQTTIIAKNQPQYRPLPAYKYRDDPEGKTVFCWRLSWRDRMRVLCGRPLWHTVLTFNQALQPQMLQLDKPVMPRQWPRAVKCPCCGSHGMKCPCGGFAAIHEICDVYHIGKCSSCYQFVDEQCPEKENQNITK